MNKHYSLLFLRISMGLLLIHWGVDKLINLDHALKVSDSFYGGLFSQTIVQQGFGIAQCLLGLLVAAGLYRAITYYIQLAILGLGALAVWPSLIDPHGLLLEGGYILFYPSLIILSGCFILLAFIQEDTLNLDQKRNA